MNYKKLENKIEIYNVNEFCPQHIFECGQVFSFKKENDIYLCYPGNKNAKIYFEKEKYIIETEDINYFENYFDLQTDYENIKKNLVDMNIEIIDKSIYHGYGIRILKQDLLETIVSFMISANNNIARIKNSLNKIREELGENLGEYYSFPNLESLKKMDENFFIRVGTGYRAPYLVETLSKLTYEKLEDMKILPTDILREKLMEYKGIGEKVANCILLYGLHREDVFPVDTWLKKVYNENFGSEKDAKVMTKKLVKIFKNNAGYAQQYLFYYRRENKIL